MVLHVYARLSNDVGIGTSMVVNIEMADEEFISNSNETYILDSDKVRNAKIGFIYDESRNGFYEPQPTPDHSLDETTLKWIPPAPNVGVGTTYIFNRDYWMWAPESPGENYIYNSETNEWQLPS